MAFQNKIIHGKIKYIYIYYFGGERGIVGNSIPELQIFIFVVTGVIFIGGGGGGGSLKKNLLSLFNALNL